MKQSIVYALLLGLTLTGSYWVWSHPDTESVVSDEAVDLVKVTTERLKSVAWDSETTKVTIDRKSDNLGDYYWITITETKTTTPPAPEPKPEDDAPEQGPEAPEGDQDAEAAAEETPEPIKTTTTVSFVGNSQTEKLWQKFAPLKALRELTGGDTEALGLNEPEATVRVNPGTGDVSLAIGGAAYGSKDRYVLFKDKTYLVDDSILRPLQYAASRLMERSLSSLTGARLEQVIVDAQGQSLQLTHQNKDDRDAQYWARADTPEENDETVGTWMDKFQRLKVRDYNVPTEVSFDSPLVSLKLSGDGTTHTVQIAQYEGEYYARSNYNRGVAHLTTSTAGDLLGDLESILD